MPLAVAVRAGEHGDAAGWMHPDLAALKQPGSGAECAGDVARRNAAGLDVARITDAAQQAFGGTGSLAGSETGHIGQRLSLVHAAAVVTHVVLQRHRSLVRPTVDEIAFADFVLRQAQLPAAAGHQSLKQVGGLRPAGAAVGIHRHGVGEPGVDLDINLRAGVLPGQQRGVQNGRHRRGKGGQVSAQVGVGVHPHRQELAIGIHRHLGVADMVAAMGIGQERLGALAGPLDAAVDLLGSPGQGHILGVQVDFRAEAATHVGRNHANLVLGQAQHKGGHQQSLDMRVLIGHIQGVLLGGPAVTANRSARLHGVGHQAVIDQVKLGDMGRRGKGSIHLRLVTERPLVAMVVWRDLVQRHRFGSITYIDHRAQRFVIHLHGLGGVFGLLQGLGNHHRHLVAHVAGTAQGQHRVRRLLHGGTVGVVDQPAAGQAAHLALEVLANENFHHAGHGVGAGQVNALDQRMRVRAAHKHRIGLGGKRDVVGVLTGPGEEAVVFLTAHSLANMRQFRKIGCTHDVSPLLGSHGRLALLHGFDDVLVASAAADIALQQGADVVRVGLGVVLAQIDCAHHHAGGAKTALQPVAFLESRLHRVHGAVGSGQPFNGGDLRTICLGRQHIAGFDGSPIHDDGTGAALGGVAAHMGAGEFELLTQHLHQQGVGRNLKRRRLAVNLELNMHG